MEVITSGLQNNGVSTVWALATLGGIFESRKSNKKGVKRKEILDVSIPDTCEVIELNSSDITLRQVSSLLYGVTICYHRKTEYFLSDVNAILSQLTRAATYNSNLTQARSQNNAKNFSLQTLSNYLSARSKQFFADNNSFLKDDKKFDIQYIPLFDDFLDGQSSTFGVATDYESAIIRRKDYITELSNSNYPGRDNLIDEITDVQFNKYDLNPNLEDIPIDMDFELDINDVVSRGGSSVLTDKTDQSSLRNLGLDNISKPSSKYAPLELEENILQPLEIDLEIQTEQPQSDLIQNQDVGSLHSDITANTIPKRRKVVAKENNGQFTSYIVTDSRIGLSTETLRNCHENYVVVMQRDDRNSRLSGTKRKRLTLENILSLENEIPLVKHSWEGVFSNSHLFNVDNKYSPIIERGRRNDMPNSLNYSNTGSVRSTEVGRRQSNADFGLSQINNDDSLLLNLDQINDDIMDGDLHDTSVMNSIGHSKQPDDFINMNLQLLSSSVGRNLSRYSTSNNFNSDEPDLVGALSRQRDRSGSTISKGSSTRTIEDGSFDSGNTRAAQSEETGLGVQARKFYQFIKERSLFDNITVNPSSRFPRKLTFENIVPSKQDKENEFGNKKISKRVVSGAFFTLLALASQNMIEITVSGVDKPDKFLDFAIDRGTDIIISV